MCRGRATCTAVWQIRRYSLLERRHCGGRERSRRGVAPEWIDRGDGSNWQCIDRRPLGRAPGGQGRSTAALGRLGIRDRTRSRNP